MHLETAIKRWGQPPKEWICAKHWARLTKDERRVKNRLDRLGRRRGWNEQLHHRTEVVWLAIKRRLNDDALLLP